MCTTRSLLQEIRGYLFDIAFLRYPGYLPSGERASTHPVWFASDRWFERFGGIPYPVTYPTDEPVTPART